VQRLGFTRSSRQTDHFLVAPDTFIRAPFPGMANATAIVHVAPAAGARFTQYTVEMGVDGLLGPTAAQRFIYVIEGEVVAVAGDRPNPLSPGGYAFYPAGTSHLVTSRSPARLAVIEKAYVPAEGAGKPEVITGNENALVPQPLLDDPWVEVRTLLPPSFEFDFAVNTLTFRPGAALPLVESHVMEHGLLMLEGGGIYRLGENWYPVTAGDFIWMAPYCPQWFGAIGKTPAKYLLYKDFNRAPL
jgi:(S)-ureidoglycine aminohydrolase